MKVNISLLYSLAAERNFLAQKMLRKVVAQPIDGLTC